MRLRLLALATLFAATSAHAQEKEVRENFELSASLKGTPRQVYRASMDALAALGYEFRALLLDEAILTLPHTTPETQELGADAVAVKLEFEPRGDSTQITLASAVLRKDPAPCRGEACQKLTGASLLASASALERILKTFEAAPPAAPSRGDSLAAAGAYGYSSRNPIRVGGGVEDGAASERRFLATLRGPGGEVVTFVRLGSCCHHPSPHGLNGTGVLDAYEVTYPGLARPVVLYVDMYEEEAPRAVEGFTRVPSAPAAETTR
jgi:hypothetical protein